MLNRIQSVLSLDNRALFLVVTLLSVVPLWIPDFLPLVDVAQHAAQVASLHEIWSDNGLFTATFEINWFTPYLGGYLLLYLVSLVLPIVLATKLVVSAAAIALPVVTGMLLREFGGDEKLRWLAIPAGYSFALYWGFMVYLVAIPLSLVLVLLTIRFDRDPTPKRAAGIALYSIMLFYCHVIALGFAALISLTYLLARNLRDPEKFAKCAIPYVAPLPLIFLWMSGVLSTEASVQNAPFVLGGLRERLVVLFMQFSGLDGIAYGVSLLTVGVILLAPFAVGYRIDRRPERWLPFVVGLGVYMVFPSYMQNTAFLFQRLAVFLVPLWLIIWAPPARPTRTLTIGLPAAVAFVLVVWMGVNGNRFLQFARESQSFTDVIEQAQPGRKLAGMLFCNASEVFVNPVYLHYPAWYQATAAGVADMSFATTHPSLVRYREMSAPRVNEALAWAPEAFEWERDGGDDYDYYLVCSGTRAAGVVFKDHADSIELVAHEEPWWLYRNVDRVAVATP